jgi:two-component system sensor histidine kinase/response regulator
MEKRAIEWVWEQADIPVLFLEPEEEGCRVSYQNAAARQLCPAEACILDMIPRQEREDLAAALRGGGRLPGPLFIHVGEAVYAAVLFQWGKQQACLLQEATAYYQNNQQALQEAVMASQAKTNFLSEMSHDIRTPMGAIIGLTEIALSQPEVPFRIRECLEKVKVASDHMMSLLNEVLDMSRIESGKIVIQPASVSVADLLHEILIVARPQADAGKLQFHLEMGAVEQERILADGVRLKQICLNLLSNAVKYTPAGGQVELFFSVLQDGCPKRVRMIVRVQDTGIGMSREFLRKLFTPFEREEKSTISKIQGTGLGMAITRNLVEQMGGSIQVTSEPNRGSCFMVEIPFEAAEEEDNAAIRALAEKRVLLLDDSSRQGERIRQMLKSLHMRADWARDADTAVCLINDADLAGTEYFAFLTVEKLSDVDIMLFLPEVRRRIGNRVPILMLSESDWSQTEYMFTRAGVDGFIPMPLFKSRLAAELCAYTTQGKGRQSWEPEAPKRDFSQKRLLLVEDNELNREIAQELLGESGLQIETAEDGRQAVEIFKQHALFYYDMILMDIQMPVMNGLEATRAIRGLQREDAARIPIIAMTANAFVEDIQSSLEAGMNAHISKPLDMEKVFSTMERFLKGAGR